jgi:hypothetical protein
MQSETNFQHDEAKPDTQSHISPDELSQATARDLRQLKILEFQDSALKNQDALRSIVDAHTGGLFAIGTHLESAILETLSPTSGQAVDIAELSPSLESFLKVARQAERYVTLSLRIAAPPKAQLREMVAKLESLSADKTSETVD